MIDVLDEELPAKFKGAIVGGVYAEMVDVLGVDNGPRPLEFLA